MSKRDYGHESIDPLAAKRPRPSEDYQPPPEYVAPAAEDDEFAVCAEHGKKRSKKSMSWETLNNG